MPFKITPSGRKPLNKLEYHLIEVSKAWCQGKNQVELITLAHFHRALQREADLYCQHNSGVTRYSIVIVHGGKGDSQVVIRPTHATAPTAVIELLSAEELDHKEVQDSLLIPLR